MSILKINPMSAEEAYRAKNEGKLKNHVFPKGKYEFKVYSAEAAISKTGNQMIKVTLRLEAFKDGKPISNLTNDWLLLEGKTAYKLRNFCESIGLGDDYANGEIDTDLMKDRRGVADVYIDKSTDDRYPVRADHTEEVPKIFIPDKNKVNDYVVDNTRVKKPVVKNEIIDDAIPF